MNPFMRIGSLLALKRTQGIVLGLLHISRWCVKIRKAQGSRGLALNLKAILLYLYALHGGHELGPNLTSTEFGPHVSLTGRSVPRMIPVQWRGLIVRGGWQYQLVLSICGLYRVLDFKGKLSVSTIVEPGKVISQDLLDAARDWGSKVLPKAPLMKMRLSPMLSSGPSSSVDVSGKAFALSNIATILGSVYTMYKSGFIKERMLAFGRALDGGTRGLIHSRIHFAFRVVEELDALVQEEMKRGLQPSVHLAIKPLGKIGLKDEPGKVRVFAIVDCFTQWVMEPLHDILFDWLRPNLSDATFDQDAGVERARVAIKAILDKTGKAFVASFDLSAATDRLPLSVQKEILNGFGSNQAPFRRNVAHYDYRTHLGDLWGALLVDRDYLLPKAAREQLGIEKVRYAVGQPIGALSSWAMLATTHHWCVYIASLKSGYSLVKPFTAYIVLGDDIIIWDESVAKDYHEFMTKDLGVKISLAKSLVSTTGVFEFAKRLIHPTHGIIQGVPLKEFALASRNLSAIAILIKGFRLNVSATRVLDVLGFGFRVRGSLAKIAKDGRASFALLWALMPGITTNSASGWLDWFLIKGISPISARIEDRVSINDAITKIFVKHLARHNELALNIKSSPYWNRTLLLAQDLFVGKQWVVDKFRHPVIFDNWEWDSYIKDSLDSRIERTSLELLEWQSSYLDTVEMSNLSDQRVDALVELLSTIPESAKLRDEWLQPVPQSLVRRDEGSDLSYIVPIIIKIRKEVTHLLVREEELKKDQTFFLPLPKKINEKW